MMLYPFLRFTARFWLICSTLAALAGSGPAARAQAQTITFAHQNVSDLRGILNLFAMFEQACLQQPFSSDLPSRLVPEDYRVVSRMDHLWGAEGGALTGKSAILSKTGSEQADQEGGHPFVDFSAPSATRPDGFCAVKWKRAWDYEKGRARLALGLYGVLDAQISYHLEAVLKSRPDDSLIWKRRTYGGVSDWSTNCWDGNRCGFKVLYEFDPDTGIELSIHRETVSRQP